MLDRLDGRGGQQIERTGGGRALDRQSRESREKYRGVTLTTTHQLHHYTSDTHAHTHKKPNAQGQFKFTAGLKKIDLRSEFKVWAKKQMGTIREQRGRGGLLKEIWTRQT